MSFLRNDRIVALILIGCALIGLALANSTFAETFFAIGHQQVSIVGLHLSAQELVTEFGLVFFFMLIGFELRHEFESGIFRNPRSALSPALAAAFGVLLPAMFYLVIVWNDSRLHSGWVIPTATDVTFSLAIFAIFGKTMSKSARSYLLAIVVIDDIIAVVLIAIIFSSKLNYLALVIAICCFAVFGFNAKFSSLSSNRPLRWLQSIVSAATCLVGWYFTVESGVHPAISGVLIAFLFPKNWVSRITNLLTGWVNGLVLPLFALFSTAVPITMAGLNGLLLLALLSAPIAKTIGITLGGWLGAKMAGNIRPAVSLRQLFKISTLGGIGFTVSLLVARLSFTSTELADQSTFSLLCATALAIVLSATVLSLVRERN